MRLSVLEQIISFCYVLFVLNICINLLLSNFLDEFHRAVKICTGTNLSSHLVHTVFAIFDDDGDGLLSYREFIAIMKDRLHRGLKVSNFNRSYEITYINLIFIIHV